MQKVELEALLERVEKATGPDRELDGTIGDALNVSVLPSYTSSIDATVAFVERMLPGWRVCMTVGQDYSKTQFVRGWGARTEHFGGSLTERADNELPLCILAALLRALISETKDGQ